MSLSWIPWYLNDWLASPTRLDMTAEERGIYRDTLDLLAQYGGKLPADKEKLQRLLLVTPEEFERSFPATARQLSPAEAGYFSHDKVLKVLEDQSTKQKKHHERAVKAARARWQK